MKKFLVSILAASMVLSLAACGGSSSSSSSSTTAAASGDEKTSDASSADGDTFVIGEIGPLTGSAASYGISVKNACELAINEINDAGGVKVGDKTYKLALNAQDDEAKEDKAKTAYSTLQQSGINALIGCVTSGACLAVVDQTAKDGLLQITPSGSAADITKNDNVFRVCFTDPMQGKLIAQYVVDQGYESVAVLYNASDEYSVGVEEAFKEELETLGASDKIVAEESFQANDVDFNTQLTSIKQKNPTLIFIPAYYDAVALITTQAKSAGITCDFVGSDGWDGVIAQTTDTSALEGAVFLSPFVVSDPDVADFVLSYNVSYGADPDQFAADGYDTVYIIKAAMEKAGSIESADLIKAMDGLSVTGLLTGDVTFDASGEPNKGAKYVKIVNGQYTAYDPN